MNCFHRSLLALTLLWTATPSFAQEGTTLRAGAVEAADAMELRHSILPPLMAEEAIAGKKVRQFLPGPNYWVGYDTAPVTIRSIPPEFCTRFRIAVQLKPSPTNRFDDSKAEADMLLFVDSIERKTMIALPVDASLAPGKCDSAEGYIAFEDYAREPTLSGYRQLVSLVRAARENGRLPQRFDCRIRGWAENSHDCANKREELAKLPMSTLYNIDLNQDPDEDEFAGYEASFGPADDGLSWRVAWTIDDEEGIARLEMKKIGVVYH